MSDATPRSKDKLIELISPLVEPQGFEIVHVETQTQREKVLRIFIDFAETKPGRAVGIQDCVTVARALDEPLDQIPEIEQIFHGSYELEVSSPGVDRPLRTEKDFNRFAGSEVRLHTFRPLAAEELGNAAYQARNPKQKNFLGTLMGMQEGKVRLALTAGKQEASGKKGKKAKNTGMSSKTNSVEEITIPLPLISKANIEPDFEKLAAGGKENVVIDQADLKESEL